jgi:hypothetical protein
MSNESPKQPADAVTVTLSSADLTKLLTTIQIQAGAISDLKEAVLTQTQAMAQALARRDQQIDAMLGMLGGSIQPGIINTIEEQPARTPIALPAPTPALAAPEAAESAQPDGAQPAAASVKTRRRFTMTPEIEASLRKDWPDASTTVETISKTLNIPYGTLLAWSKDLGLGRKASSKHQKFEWREENGQKILWVYGKPRHPLPIEKMAEEMKPFGELYNEWCRTPTMTYQDMAERLGIPAKKAINVLGQTITRLKDDPTRIINMGSGRGGRGGRPGLLNGLASEDGAHHQNGAASIETVSTEITGNEPAVQNLIDLGFTADDARTLVDMDVVSNEALLAALEDNDSAELLGLQTAPERIQQALATVKAAVAESATTHEGTLVPLHPNERAMTSQTFLGQWQQSGFDEGQFELLNDEGIGTVGEIAALSYDDLVDALGDEDIDPAWATGIILRAKLICREIAEDEYPTQFNLWMSAIQGLRLG